MTMSDGERDLVAWTDEIRSGAKKLEMISRIVRIQADSQDDEEGDRNLADAYVAMEAIENVLAGTSSGALRQYEEAGQRHEEGFLNPALHYQTHNVRDCSPEFCGREPDPIPHRSRRHAPPEVKS